MWLKNFLQTIVLVITLGALHGLVILPVLLTIFHCEGDGGDEEREKVRIKAYAQFDSVEKIMGPK